MGSSRMLFSRKRLMATSSTNPNVTLVHTKRRFGVSSSLILVQLFGGTHQSCTIMIASPRVSRHPRFCSRRVGIKAHISGTLALWELLQDEPLVDTPTLEHISARYMSLNYISCLVHHLKHYCNEQTREYLVTFTIRMVSTQTPVPPFPANSTVS